MVYLPANHDSQFNVDRLIVQSAEPMFVLDAGIVDLDHDEDRALRMVWLGLNRTL